MKNTIWFAWFLRLIRVSGISNMDIKLNTCSMQLIYVAIYFRAISKHLSKMRKYRQMLPALFGFMFNCIQWNLLDNFQPQGKIVTTGWSIEVNASMPIQNFKVNNRSSFHLQLLGWSPHWVDKRQILAE